MPTPHQVSQAYQAVALLTLVQHDCCPVFTSLLPSRLACPAGWLDEVLTLTFCIQQHLVSNTHSQQAKCTLACGLNIRAVEFAVFRSNVRVYLC